ncbi:MAG: helix-turn-helix transcriptional regulator [Atopobiaceae bacterium]|nr:helix-turn-helix transcriptional regulator [Atopobiaceae bacterium]MBR3385488.1 helix-turn-helix transcriptional regulator [Atopobiaceae bacterium]
MEAIQEYAAEPIGRRLKSGLADAGLTVEQLAESIGVSRFAVQGWISGKSRMKLTDAAKVCDVLGWPLDRLARREA